MAQPVTFDVNVLIRAIVEGNITLLVVSSDAHLLEMSPWRGIPIVRPEEFVVRVDAMRRASRC